jgi:DNA primase
MEVKLAELPAGTDPAELILKEPEAWKDSLRDAVHLVDFYLDKLIKDKLEPRKLAKEVEKKVLPYVAMIQSSIEQSHFISQIAKRAGIREEALWNDLKKIPRGIPTNSPDTTPVQVLPEARNRKNYIERRILGIIFWQEKEKEPVVDTTKLRTLLVMIAGEPYVNAMLTEYKPLAEEIIFEAESYYGDKEALTREVTELVMNFEEDILREQFVKIMRELGDAERDKEKEKAEKLLAQCQEISQKLAELSKRRMEKA